jgi:hypothetical protein
MNDFIKDRNESDNEVTIVTSLLCKIPTFGKTVRRFPFGDKRMYFINDPVTIMNGLTGYIGMIPQKKGEGAALIKYQVKHGENFFAELHHAADYGTFCHMAVAQFLTTGVLDLNILKEEFRQYAIACGLPMVRWKNYSYRLVNDMKSFAAFAHDCEMEPLATEYCVYDEEKLIATPLDIVCRMKFNRKVIVANINLKFRENPGCYRKDEVQTSIERFMYNRKWAGTENEITHTFIWCPSNWRTEPTWKLINTTGKYTFEEWQQDHKILELLEQQGKVYLRPNIREKFATKAGGIIELNKPVILDEETVEDFCIRVSKPS